MGRGRPGCGPWVPQASAGSQPTPCAHSGGCPAVPVSLALIEHLHLPENPAPDVSQALLYDLEGKEGVPGRGRGTAAPAARGPWGGRGPGSRTGCSGTGAKRQRPCQAAPSGAGASTAPRDAEQRRSQGPYAPLGADPGRAKAGQGTPHTGMGADGCCHCSLGYTERSTTTAFPAASVSHLGHPKAPME